MMIKKKINPILEEIGRRMLEPMELTYEEWAERARISRREEAQEVYEKEEESK